MKQTAEYASSPPGALEMWTVYDHPADYPNHFVARRWDVLGGEITKTERILMAETLDSIRATLGGDLGLFCMPREPGDDPCIVETWF